MSRNEILSVRDLTVSYGPVRALREVALAVREGEIVTVIGSNGAGKTTLMKTIAGLLKPDSGAIALQERDVTGLDADRKVRLGLSLVPEGRQVFGQMSVRENLLLGAHTRAGADLSAELERCYALFPILKERLHQKAGTLSGGEQQMLAIARGLLPGPRLLLLDEPSLGLAPILVRETMNLVERLRDLGITILMVEQMARLALRHSDRAYVLEHGEIVHEGDARELARRPEILDAYFGHSGDDAGARRKSRRGGRRSTDPEQEGRR